MMEHVLSINLWLIVVFQIVCRLEKLDVLDCPCTGSTGRIELIVRFGLFVRFLEYEKKNINYY